MAAESEVRSRPPVERRSCPDRRQRVVHSLLVSLVNPRRREHRRRGSVHRAPLDYHDSRWLAIALCILLLSASDAFLTLRLLDLGAVEVNPLMAWMLEGSTHQFAWWKVGLTAAGVVVLTVMARLHLFGRVPVSLVLYLVLGFYAGLIAYEYWLLQTLQPGA